MPTSDKFEHQVTNALAHLYDPDVLISHPLIARLSIKSGASATDDLRSILTNSIEDLKPDITVPITSRTWRVYNLLNLRYIQQQDQEQTAYQLGISVRHLRREQKNAIQILSESLAHKYPLMEPTENSSVLPDEWHGPIEMETSWMRASEQESSASAVNLLNAVIHLVNPLAEVGEVKLNNSIMSILPDVAINPAILRQAFVVLITYSISRAPKGEINFDAWVDNSSVVIKIIANLKTKLSADTQEGSARLAAARTLLNVCENCLEINEQGTSLVITLRLPEVNRIRICLLDDNADIGHLFERFLTGTRYSISSLDKPDHLFEWIEENKPQIIILDVMMPGLDGWEILGRLKQHPRTSAIPVIICSVLPERELAVALGAFAYLPKPTTRAALLETLSSISGN